MAKESRNRRDERKKPALTLKEKRAKKHEKKHPREINPVGYTIQE